MFGAALISVLAVAGCSSAGPVASQPPSPRSVSSQPDSGLADASSPVVPTTSVLDLSPEPVSSPERATASVTSTMPTPSDELSDADDADSRGPGPTWVTGEDGAVTARFPEPGMSHYTGPMTTITTGGSTIIVPKDLVGIDDLADSLVISISIADGVETTGVDVEGALDAYRGYLRTADEALHEPGRDWADEFAKYSVEPLLPRVIDEIRDMAESGTVMVGHPKFTSEVVSTRKELLELRTCSDGSGMDSVDAESGAIVRAGERLRRIQDVSILRDDQGRWLVRDIEPRWDEPC